MARMADSTNIRIKKTTHQRILKLVIAYYEQRGTRPTISEALDLLMDSYCNLFEDHYERIDDEKKKT